VSQNPPEKKSAIERFLEDLGVVGEALALHLAVSTYTFSRGGWSEVPLDNMTEPEFSALLEGLLEKSDEEVKSELDTVIFEYFRRDNYAPLSELVDRWFLFEDRHQMFEDALWAHKQGRYTLSIPALAAQFEGIVRQEVNDYREGPSWRTVFLGTLEHRRENPPFPSNFRDYLSWFQALPILDRFNSVEEVRKYFTLVRIQELFDERDFADPESSSSVNRHLILHGVFRTLEELESLRLFFVLDLLHEAIGFYREAASKNQDNA